MATFIFHIFSLILFNLLGASISTDLCSTPSCNSSADYFSVRFPFRLPEYQSNIRCGYSSNFTLSCNAEKKTLMHLPNAGSFHIRNIDYSYQRVTVTDPDKCLPRRFLYYNFNLSGSPFSTYLQNFTYYNCTSGGVPNSWYYSSYKASCMSSNNYTVLVLLGTLPPIASLNCTVIKSVTAPYKLYNPDLMSDLVLNWLEPSCWSCEYGGRACGFKKGSNLIDQCEDTIKEHKFNSRLAFAIIIPGMLIMIAVGGYMCGRPNRTEEQQHQRPINSEVALIQTQPRTSATGSLSEPDMESSNPVFVLGEGDVLLEPNVSPCAICLCEYKPGDMLRTIQDCNHYFHSNCVDEWLRMKATCPVCRKGA